MTALNKSPALRLLGLALWVLGLAALPGCVGGGVPPVSDRSRVEASTMNSGKYQVVPGDTLYSIAWRHQRDFRDLAALNGIKAPYSIYPGQRLRVTGAVAARQTVHPLAQTRTKPQSGTAASSRVGPTPTVAPPAQPAERTGQVTSRAQPASPSGASARGAEVARTTGPVTLRWPGQGKRLRGFGQTAPGSPKPSVAINFLLAAGAAIQAAGPGEVVYVGRAVAGFEHFVIVKHNDTWLSAYGFNASAAVQEGQRVQSGTTLATLESGGGADASARELHFELRKDGVPVDPVGVIRG